MVAKSCITLDGWNLQTNHGMFTTAHCRISTMISLPRSRGQRKNLPDLYTCSSQCVVNTGDFRIVFFLPDQSMSSDDHRPRVVLDLTYKHQRDHGARCCWNRVDIPWIPRHFGLEHFCVCWFLRFAGWKNHGYDGL